MSILKRSSRSGIAKQVLDSQTFYTPRKTIDDGLTIPNVIDGYKTRSEVTYLYKLELFVKEELVKLYTARNAKGEQIFQPGDESIHLEIRQRFQDIPS